VELSEIKKCKKNNNGKANQKKSSILERDLQVLEETEQSETIIQNPRPKKGAKYPQVKSKRREGDNARVSTRLIEGHES